jgi:branched-chain amino acid transport system permease protein
MGNRSLRTSAIGLALIAVVLLMAFLVLLGTVDRYIALIIIQGSINVIIALSLNVISGFTGQLALGQAGFMAIGAYSSAFVAMQLKLPIIAGIASGGLVSAIFGLAIGFPALRLRGDYLAIVTLGFGEIIRVVMINLGKLTGGSAGLKGIPSFISTEWWLRTFPKGGDARNPIASWLSTLPITTVLAAFGMLWTGTAVILVFILVRNLIASSWGRAITAVRDDEIAAKSMGINTFGHKMFAFTLSAFLAGVGGALYAHYFRFLAPTDFTFLKSVDFLIIVVLGGMGSATGTLISGYVLTSLQESLRFLKDFRLVIYPFILILIMLFRPGGLMGKQEISIAGIGRWLAALALKLRAAKKAE